MSIIEITRRRTACWGRRAAIISVLALSATAAHAFSLAPLTLRESKGILQVRNSSSKTIRVSLNVYLPRVAKDKPALLTPGTEPVQEDQIENYIKLRPRTFRLAANGIRDINYVVVKSPSVSFFVCASSPQGNFLLRVCSRWDTSRQEK